MPFKSKAQFRYAEMLAHDPSKAKKPGSVKWAKDWTSKYATPGAIKKLPERKTNAR